MKITILGGGSMGVALAALLAGNGHKVSIWTPIEQEALQINTERGIPERLPGILLPDSVLAYTNWEAALVDCQLITLAVPSVHMRTTAKRISVWMEMQNGKSIPVVCCSKGLELDTGFLLSEVLEQELQKNPVVALSGPSYAIEIAQGMPTAMVSASKSPEAATFCQTVFMNENFRVYTSNDITGVELGGALKNVIALCAGILDGVGYRDNSKAALLTRGIVEISRLGVAMGAESQTFFGLTGMGDMILTCTGAHSRNKQAGYLLGKGYSLAAALSEVNMVVEGVSAAKPAQYLARKYQVDMPIIQEANAILYEGRDPKEAVLELMRRDKKSEF